MHESILSEMARNEVSFPEFEEKVMRQYNIVVDSFENITNDWALDRLQQYKFQAKEVIEGITNLLVIINNQLQAELFESGRKKLKAKQSAYLKGVETLTSIQEAIEQVIFGNFECENKKLLETLRKERKLVIDLQQQIQQQSNDKRCAVCLTGQANIAFVPCGHVSTCRSCSSQLQNKCPMCRQDFTSSVRVYN